MNQQIQAAVLCLAASLLGQSPACAHRQSNSCFEFPVGECAQRVGSFAGATTMCNDAPEEGRWQELSQRQAREK